MARLVLKAARLHLTPNETMIRSETDRFSVALDDATDYAAQVGIIISLFSLVESYMPLIVSRICNFDKHDAKAILGVFRSFSNRIDLIKELARIREDGSIDKLCLSYYLGLFKESNNIRNKYAHATYSYAKTHFVIRPYSGDFTAKRSPIDASIEYFKKDAKRLRRINCELHAFCYRNEIPESLHKTISRRGL